MNQNLSGSTYKQKRKRHFFISDVDNQIWGIPKSLCDNQGWLENLDKILKSIRSPALSRFTENIFADKETAMSYLLFPASCNDHHSHKSGLLAHSVEAASIADVAYRMAYDTPEERDITVIAALLHDIGKTRTLGNNNQLTMLGKLVEHDDLTLEVCAPALKQLDKDWPDAAYTLRHIWTSASPGARYGHESYTRLSNIVRFADRTSAESYNHQVVYDGKHTKSGLIWRGGKRFWRPAPETNNKERKHACLLNTTR